MSRSRIIKPEFCKSKSLNSVKLDSNSLINNINENINSKDKVKRDPLYPEYQESDFKNFEDIFIKFCDNFKDVAKVGLIETHWKHQDQIGLMQGWKKLTIYNKCVSLIEDEKYKITPNG